MTLKIVFNALEGTFDYVDIDNGAFQRILAKNLTLANGESLVIARYINLNGKTLTLNGDATLEITN